MSHIEDCILLNMVYNLGFKKLEALLRFYDTPRAVLDAPRRELAKIPGIGATLADEIASLKRKDLDKELSLMKKSDVSAISVFDARYPDNLKNSYSPPLVLYVKGAIRKEDADSAAIVGSRMASYYGLSIAEKLSSELAACGVTIVSGMARGIDTAAHKGALGSGRTIAVLGSGLGHIYPPENKNLAGEISARGALVSEFPMNTPPLKINFPRRNRVISGLGLCVVVVEAGKKSGALITVDFALQDGRDVFAVPGRVDSKTSAGTNRLLKEGAVLVEETSDVFDGISSKLRFCEKSECVSAKKTFARRELSEEEKAVASFLSYEPVHIDELAEKKNMSIDKLASLLVGLEIKNVARELPGKNFVLR